MIAAGLAVAAPAHAAPTVTLDVRGTCPGPDQVRAALAPWIAIADDAAWTVAVADRRGVATLELSDRDGVVLSRRITSTDCAAVADAFAVMIHSHFVELHLMPATEPAAPDPSAGFAPPAAVPEPIVTTAAPTRVEPVDRGAPIAPAPRPTPTAVRLAAAGGVAVGGATSGFGQLDAAWELRPGWIARGAISGDAPTTIGATGQRVAVFRSIARIGVGRRLRAGAASITPAVDAGLAVWRFDPLDSGNNVDPMNPPSTWHVQPVVDGSIAAAVPIAPRVALRLELTGTVFVVRDHYVAASNADPTSAGGQSPRAAIAIGAGVEWSIR